MAKWADIESSEKYQGLAEDQQSMVREKYFERAIAPNIPDGKLEETRAAWAARFQPSLTPMDMTTREGRQIYKDNAGEYVTERSITAHIPILGGYVNLPTVYGGKELSQEDAVAKAIESGGYDPVTNRRLYVHPDLEPAVAEAQARSQKLGDELAAMFAPEPTAIELAQTAGGSLIKGAQMATKVVPDAINMVGGMISDNYPNTLPGHITHALSDQFEEGIEATDELIQPDTVREAIRTNKIYDPDTGEWRFPNAGQVTDTVFSVVPMIPAFIVGGGATTNLLSKVLPNAAAVPAGYGSVNAVVGGSDSFSEATQEARRLLEQDDRLNREEQNVIANIVAKEATQRQLPVAFLMGAIGLGGASQVPGNIVQRVASGAAVDAIPELIEEGSQGLNINMALAENDVDPDRSPLEGVPDRAVLGAIGGGVVGGGIAAAAGVAPNRSESNLETEVQPETVLQGQIEPQGQRLVEIAEGLYVDPDNPRTPPFEGAIKAYEVDGLVAWRRPDAPDSAPVVQQPIVEEPAPIEEFEPLFDDNMDSYEELAQPATTALNNPLDDFAEFEDLVGFNPEQQNTQEGIKFDDTTGEILEAEITEARAEIDRAGAEAATSPLNDLPEPTIAQREAGNYKKAHVKVNGFDITIENPKGSQRRGVDRDGKEWAVEMAHDYGYIRRTRGADDSGSDVKTDIEHVDVFVGPNPEAEGVYVVNQVIDGEFDEHKVMMGFNSQEEAVQAYRDNYDVNWDGLDSIVEMDSEKFRGWVYDSEQTSKPVVDGKSSNVVNVVDNDQDDAPSQQLVEPKSIKNIDQEEVEVRRDPIEAEIEQYRSDVSEIQSPIEFAQRVASDPETSGARVEAFEKRALQLEKSILNRHSKKRVDDLDETELSDIESEFLYYSDFPTDHDSFKDIYQMLSPIDTKEDAVTELRRAMAALPESNDANVYTKADEYSVGRLLVLSSEMDRLGLDPQQVVLEAIKEEVARYDDDIDAEFMGNELRDKVSRFIDIPEPSVEENSLLEAPKVEQAGSEQASAQTLVPDELNSRDPRMLESETTEAETESNPEDAIASVDRDKAVFEEFVDAKKTDGKSKADRAINYILERLSKTGDNPTIEELSSKFDVHPDQAENLLQWNGRSAASGYLDGEISRSSYHLERLRNAATTQTSLLEGIDLANTKIMTRMVAEDTKEVFDLPESADVVLRRADKRIKSLEKLLECVKK